MTGQHGLDPAQQHAVTTAIGVVRAWVEEQDDPEAAILGSLREQDPATAPIGLATVARLLAIELGACSHRTEQAVLAGLAEHVSEAVPAADGPGRRR